jgi:hypothetical protein
VDTPSLRAREPCRRKCDRYWAQETRHLAHQAERGSASRLRGLLRTRGDALGSGCSGVLSGHGYRSCIGCGAPHHNGGVYDRVRASFPQQQPRRGVLILERERRRPNGTKSACLRALKGRGRAGATCGGVSARFHLPTGVHLPRRAAENRISATGLCARSTPRFGCCSRTR